MQTQIEQHTLFISGDVNVRTLNSNMCRTFAQQCTLPEINTLDFARVKQADSACLSLLLIAKRARSGSLNTPLAVHNLPDAVNDLANLYEIQEWISA